MPSVNIQIAVTGNISNLPKIFFTLIITLKKPGDFWILIFSNSFKNTFLTISTHLISPDIINKGEQ